MSTSRRHRRRPHHRSRHDDSFVDIDTIRHSVPHRLVRDLVEVLVTAAEVRVYHGTALVAAHARSFEPHAKVVHPAHFQGLWRAHTENVVPRAEPLASLGRTLEDNATVVGGAA